MLPIPLSLLASSSTHWRLTHCLTITSLLNPLVLSRHCAWSSRILAQKKSIIIIIYDIVVCVAFQSPWSHFVGRRWRDWVSTQEVNASYNHYIFSVISNDSKWFHIWKYKYVIIDSVSVHILLYWHILCEKINQTDHWHKPIYVNK